MTRAEQSPESVKVAQRADRGTIFTTEGGLARDLDAYLHNNGSSSASSVPVTRQMSFPLPPSSKI